MASHGIPDLVRGRDSALSGIVTTHIRWAIGCALVGLAAAACSSRRSAETTIAVIPKGQAHVFWQSVRAGAERCAADERVSMIWTAPSSETDFTGQANIIEDFVNRRVNAIVLAPSHRKALVPATARAVREGIPVVIIDSGLDFDQAVSFVATDNRQGGVLAARRMGELLGGTGSVAILGIAAGAGSGLEREGGFQETIRAEFPGIKVVGYQFTESDRTRGLAVAEDFLTRFPDLAGLFGSNESSAVAAARAVANRGLKGRVHIVGFDTSSDLLQAVRDGTIDALVAQQPYRMGCEGVRSAVSALHHQPVPARIDTGTVLVTRANIDSAEVQQLVAPSAPTSGTR
jgi:ribose transport system substrate-binding protein